MHATTLIYGAIALAASVNARALDQSFAKRHAFGTPEGTCAPQPSGSGPVTNNPDTSDAFLANPVYGKIANKASTPAGYALQYQNQQWASTSSGYLGVEELDSYDVAYCASQCCSATSWAGCQSFNIYFERDPIVDPGVNCTNPASTTRIKCSYWTGVVSTADEHNDGQYCSGFHVVIAGSNGYKANSCPASSSTTPAPASTTTTSTPVSTSSTTTTAPATPTGVCTCANGQGPSSFYTASNGDKYGICIDTDFNGGDLPNGSGTIYSITSDQACADACSATAGCVAATLHKDASVCYLKGTLQPAVTASGEDSVCKIGSGPSTSTSATTTKPTSVSTTATTTKPTTITTPSTLTTSTKPTTVTKPTTTSTSCTTDKNGKPTSGPNPPAGPGPNPPAGPGPNPPAGPGPNPPAPAPKPADNPQPWVSIPAIPVPQLPKPASIFQWVGWN